jgi:outer membrane protein assembly factor BamE
MRIFIVFMLVLGVAGCKQNPELPAVISPYRIDIQQGNVVTQEMVDKLKVGLTRSQVRFVLGSPLVIDMFHENRWDYIYLLQRQGKADERRRLTVIFDGDKLASVEGDVVLTDKVQEPAPPIAKPPAAKPPAASVPKPAAATPLVTTPATKPATAPAQPVKAPATWPAAAKPDAAAQKPVVPAEKDAASATPADTAAADAVKSDAKGDAPAPAAKTDAAKTDAAKADDKKDAPKSQRGPFGRMLEKIGL